MERPGRSRYRYISLMIDFYQSALTAWQEEQNKLCYCPTTKLIIIINKQESNESNNSLS